MFRIISIPSNLFYFRPPDHVISMECSALNFWCQCTQHKLQSICAVLTFDPQLKKILAFSVKDRYQLNYFICIKDFNYFFRITFVFFLYLRLSASLNENDLPLCIYFWYQTDSGVPNTSIYIYSAVPWRLHIITITYNLPHLRLWYADVVTVIA